MPETKRRFPSFRRASASRAAIIDSIFAYQPRRPLVAHADKRCVAARFARSRLIRFVELAFEVRQPLLDEGVGVADRLVVDRRGPLPPHEGEGRRLLVGGPRRRGIFALTTLHGSATPPPPRG